MINQRRKISSSDSVVQSLTKKWNKRAADFIEKQEVNPFSDRYTGKFYFLFLLTYKNIFRSLNFFKYYLTAKICKTALDVQMTFSNFFLFRLFKYGLINQSFAFHLLNFVKTKQD